MQKVVLIILPVLFAGMISCHRGSSGAAQAGSTLPDTGKPDIKFKTLEHDFGEIIAGESVACIFYFTNSGTGNLLLSSVSTSCGCTVSKYDKKPVPPGGSGRVEVVFDSSGRSGKQRKTIAVRANTDPPVTLLTIYATVKEKE